MISLSLLPISPNCSTTLVHHARLPRASLPLEVEAVREVRCEPMARLAMEVEAEREERRRDG